jgi:hypothetical protein
MPATIHQSTQTPSTQHSSDVAQAEHAARPTQKSPPAQVNEDRFEDVSRKFRQLTSVSKPAVTIGSGMLGPELDEQALLLGNALIPASVSTKWEKYPPLAYAAREAKKPLLEQLLALRDINVGARDACAKNAVPYKTILMHAVQGALVHKDSSALETLLADKRIKDCVSDVVYAMGKSFTALDFPLQQLDADPGSALALGVALSLMAKGAEPKAFGYVIDEHPVLSKVRF